MNNEQRHIGIDQRLVSLFLPCLIVLLGAALRFYDLGAESYWYDEVITVRLAEEGLRAVVAEFLRIARSPLHVLLTSVWMRVVGSSEFATRSLSAFAGIVNIALIYKTGCSLFSRRVGLVSAVILTLSEFQIHYSQESRYYALFLTFTLLSFIFFVQALERNRDRARVCYVLATTAMCYTHTYGVFVVVAQNLHFLVQLWLLRPSLGTGQRRAWFGSQVLTLLALAPFSAIVLADVLGGTHDPMRWIPDPSAWKLPFTLLQFVGSGYPALTTAIAATVFSVAAVVAHVLVVGKRQWLKAISVVANPVKMHLRKRSELLLMAFWLLCPLLIPWLLSKLLGPMYIVRYAISAAPALYVILGYAAATVRGVVPEPVVLGFVAILVAPGLYQYYAGITKENWRGAARYVEENLRRGDSVVVPHRVLGRWTFDWYYEGAMQDCDCELVFGSGDEFAIDGETAIAAAKECAPDSDRFWLILRSSVVRGGRLDSVAWRSAGLRVVEKPVFEGVLVYLFEKTDGGSDASAPRKACFRTEQQPGVTEDRNSPMRRAQRELLIVIDDDAVFATDTAIRRAVELLSRSPETGVLAFKVINHENGRIRLKVPFSELTRRCWPDIHPRRQPVSYYLGTAHALWRELIERCGAYQEEFLFGEEDQAVRNIQLGAYVRGIRAGAGVLLELCRRPLDGHAIAYLGKHSGRLWH
jgi:uncharacterized membrane protein